MSQFLCSGGDKKMAESKGSLLAKSVSKHAGRAKEKVIWYLFYFLKTISCFLYSLDTLTPKLEPRPHPYVEQKRQLFHRTPTQRTVSLCLEPFKSWNNLWWGFILVYLKRLERWLQAACHADDFIVCFEWPLWDPSGVTNELFCVKK